MPQVCLAVAPTQAERQCGWQRAAARVPCDRTPAALPCLCRVSPELLGPGVSKLCYRTTQVHLSSLPGARGV